MKILKIFGIVVGIHLFALILIFANPGCSSTTKPPSVSDAGSDESVSPIVAAPIATSSGSMAANQSDSGSSAITFHPDTPAAAAPIIDTGVRFSPTRPGTPVASAILAEPAAADVLPAASYTVKSGDNLWTIARKNNLTVTQLTKANGISARAILRPGQKLVIPQASASSAGNAASTASAAPAPKLIDPSTGAVSSRPGPTVFKHVVKSGETLGAIARRYDVRQGDLAVANSIADPARIRPGQELIVPGWKSPANKAAKPSNEPVNAVTPAVQPSPAANLDLLQSEPAQSAPPPVPVIQIEDEPVPAPL